MRRRRRWSLSWLGQNVKVVKPHKATGPHEIPARVLKETASEISTIVQHIPTITHHRQTPTSLDHSSCHTNIQIYKKGNKSNPANYRPISLTCILCKVMEHIVLSHMWKHLNANDVILHHQHGFQTDSPVKPSSWRQFMIGLPP